MRKVILGLAVSLDGYIARENGDVDWLSMEDLTEAADEGQEFFETIDTVIFGRKTYEKGLELGGGAIAGKTNYVFSLTLPEGKHKNVNFVSVNAKDFVEKLKQQDGKNILLMGGGNLAKTFFEEKLIDELILGIQPKIIGKGIPLFLPHNHQTNLELINVKTRKSGTVQVTYLVK
jgi:dihydrofolate reductase